MLGTTAAGLRFGKPTWICPFFGDQHFWGEMIYRRKLGPRPVAVETLDFTTVIDSFSRLIDKKIISNAAEISKKLGSEDGVENAVASFYRHLPIQNMICDVSILLGQSRLAQVMYRNNEFFFRIYRILYI